MRTQQHSAPVMLEAGPSSIRGTDWGDMRVAVVSVPAGADFAPLMKGLPNNRCQSPHWGYVLTGRLRVQYQDRDEVLQAGDLYYILPGHTGVAEEDTEFIEISPPGPHQQFLDTARQNLAKVQAGAE